ncbi:sporulation/spore germination protein [Thermanaerovibrio velox DSM 12556]|uniref:Sporulation/spore germination protein n=1 Tax=Thermanaerovibrio velox DSM 12556 TaxID=926567 RepID=H0UNS4_9BACT|nr:GerMN domain-containing protein [Thermanaerovibrio velox]EHM09410.1 sporulation/spore germination protein [Thermanaerovibrio velox DSM 12556]
MWREDSQRDRDRYGRDRYRGREPEEGREGRKAPLPFRVIAWASLVAIFFGVGYGVTSLAFKYLDSGGRNVRGTVNSPEEVSVEGVSEDSASKSDRYEVYLPSGTSLEGKEFKVSGVATDEEAMKGVLEFFMAELTSSGWMKGSVQVLHLFRSGEWLYLDLSSSFLEGLKALGKDRAQLVMTGIVKTVAENFPPIRKVKVYVDGQDVSDKSVVDLSKPWALKQ